MNNNAPQMSGMSQVIFNEGDQAAQPIAAEDALTQNDIRLSKRQKLAMPYQGVKEIEQTWQTSPTYENVGGTYQFVEKEARPSLAIGETDDGLVFENGSSSSANDGLIGPDVPAIAEDAQDPIINDMPGKSGGEAMTGENYLSLPGYPVATSATSAGALVAINAMAVANDASALTVNLLVLAGVPKDMIITDDAHANAGTKLPAYKSAVAAATSITTIDELVEIIFTVNKA